MQIAIDFNGKKVEKITISVSEELRHALQTISKETNIPVSQLCGEYAAECAGRDFGKLMILQSRGKAIIDMAKV